MIPPVLAFFDNLPVEAWLLLITGIIAGIQKLVEWSGSMRRKSREAEHEREGGGVDLGEYERDKPPRPNQQHPTPQPASPQTTRDQAPPPPPITIPGSWMPGEPPAENTPPQPPGPVTPKPVRRPAVRLPVRKAISIRPILPPRTPLVANKSPGKAPARHAAPATAHRQLRGGRWTRALSKSRRRQREAMVLQEIFGAPLALRRSSGRNRNPRRPS